MKPIGKSKVSRQTSKKNAIYPFVRFPQGYEDLIGNTMTIYETEHEGRRAFLLVPYDETISAPKVIQPIAKLSIEKRIDGLETKINQVIDLINSNKEQNGSKPTWARRDSNTRSSPCEGDVIAN